MADPVTMAMMAGGLAVKGLGALFGGRSQRNAQKQAGTLLADTAEREQARALGFPDIINPYIDERYGQTSDALEQRARQGYEDVMGQTREANAYLNPYATTGRESLATLSQLAQAAPDQFNFQFSQDDPSYQFRLAEGQKALERSAAARGILQTGGTLKALTRYGQDAASQEYQAAFNRAKSTFDVNQAARQQRLGTLSGLAGLGYSASAAQGQNLIGGTKFGADLTQQAAQIAGGWRNQSTNLQAQNIIDANNIARQLRLQGVQASANSILGAGQATSDIWGGVTGSLGSGLTLAGMAKGGYLGGQPSVGKVKIPNWVYTGQGMPGGSAPWGGYPGSSSSGLGGTGYEYMIPGLGF